MTRHFIMLASSRKGTHVITTALAHHPALQVWGQVLRRYDLFPEQEPSPLAASLFDAVEAPVVVLPTDIAIVIQRGLLEELRRREVGVMHLHRRNMLRWHLSELIARATGQWIATENPGHSDVTVRVDPASAMRQILADWRQDRMGARHFASHPTLHLWYEDLTESFDSQIMRVQAFLGMAIMPLRPKCYKQQTRPLPDVISNYAELLDAWRGTPFEWFLRDDCCLGVQP